VVTVDQAANSVLTNESVWFQVVVKNIGGSTATGVAVASTLGPLPFGQNTATAACDPSPTTIAANVTFTCRYSVDAGTPGTIQNTVTVTSSNAVPPGRNNVATANITNCASPKVLIPNLLARTKTQAEGDWTAAGFTLANLTSWKNKNSDPVLTQSKAAFQCVAASSTMTITH
jgi:hypothetical protein